MSIVHLEKRIDNIIELLSLYYSIIQGNSRQIFTHSHLFDDLDHSLDDVDNVTEVADRIIGKILLKQFQNLSMVKRITVQGLEEWTREEDSDDRCKYWVNISPLDGSLNYQKRGSTLGLPYTLVITVMEKIADNKFSDLAYAVVRDYRKPYNLWFAYKTQVGYKGFLGNHILKKNSVESLVDQIFFVNIKSPLYIEKLQQAVDFSALRCLGVSTYEMAMVASGQALAYICDKQDISKLGAGYVLVKSAGGVVVDWQGQSLDQQAYHLDKTSPVILAANQKVADQILDLLNQ